MASSSPLLFFLLLSSSFFVSLPATVAAVQTFTYVNSGELGPYITEYGADYRPLPIYSSPFQMCFYNTTPDAFFLALRMGTLRSESTFRWVWEANRGRPVRDNATFSLRADGDLVLAEADGRAVWSTATAGKDVAGLRVLPNGNIVLYDARGRFVWQSFDHPTDTLLVGQSLRAAGPRRLVSRRSAVDGSYGMYSLVMESGGLAMYINDTIPYYNYSDGVLSVSGTLSSLLLESEPETDEAFAYEIRLAVNSSNGGGTIILARPKYNGTLSFLRLAVDGNLEMYTYYDPVDYRAWERTFALFSDEDGRLSGCALPSKCGALGVCEDEMCVACPAPAGLLGWSRACEPPRPAACGGRVDYYKVEGVESFVSSYGRGEGVVSVDECRRRCSADCKCVGFLYWTKESKCWLAPLLGTLSKVANSSHVAYIKISK